MSAMGGRGSWHVSRRDAWCVAHPETTTMIRLFACLLALLGLSLTASASTEELYLKHCGECHGAERLGSIGPALLPENLRRLRTALYPSTGLQDLIQTTADLDVRDTKMLYEEAIETLRLYSEELRNQPERAVQDELRDAEELLQEVEKRLQDPYAPLDETKFLVSSAERNTAFSEGTVAAYDRVIDQLTESCQTCHIVEKSTIKRAQDDQRTLIRSQFDHRAHIIQSRCLDCHNTIPIREMAILDSIPPPAVDRAEIHNLPSITNCQSCHANNQASNTCITCHEFHPDKSQHANLLLYVD